MPSGGCMDTWEKVGLVVSDGGVEKVKLECQGLWK